MNWKIFILLLFQLTCSLHMVSIISSSFDFHCENVSWSPILPALSNYEVTNEIEKKRKRSKNVSLYWFDVTWEMWN